MLGRFAKNVRYTINTCQWPSAYSSPKFAVRS